MGKSLLIVFSMLLALAGGCASPVGVAGKTTNSEATAAATQPMASFDVHCDKTGDAVVVSTEADRTIFAITSPSGIGGAAVERRGGSWPKQLVLRVHLRGLESLRITAGDLTLSVSVASHSGNPR